MGSGKTHWGQRLAAKLGMPFFDLDSLIIEKENKSVADIFAEKGEEFFRFMEKETLEAITEQQERFILSCGGGTPCFFNNIEFMKKSGKVIWLNTAVDVLRQRLQRERLSRPLIAEVSEEVKRTRLSTEQQEHRLSTLEANITSLGWWVKAGVSLLFVLAVVTIVLLARVR